MYSRQHNLLLIHIPKAAGQSVSTYFINLAGSCWEKREAFLMGANLNPRIGPPQVAHFTLDEYYKSGILAHDVLNRAIKFAVVRNPWDRLWSEYNYFWKDVCSWDDFFVFFPDGIIDDYTTGRDAGRHIKPQVEFINDDVEILKFENLAKDFSDFCIRHNFPNHPMLHVNNDSENGHYSAIYDEKKIEIVRNYYQKDIAAFGYEFD